MKSEQRWSVAQDYERSHWLKKAHEVAAGTDNLSWYRWKAERTAGRLSECGVTSTHGFSIIEVGSGPVGLISFLPGATRRAVDPLMGFFNSNASLVGSRPPEVEYIEGKGEELPLGDHEADLVIIDNCLDHCQDPARVLDECRRVLKRRGLLYLTLNVRHPVGWFNRGLMEMFRLDPGHPHSYYPKRLQRLLGDQGFTELGWWLQPWHHSLRENWPGNRGRALAKILSLTIERLAEGVWRVA